MTEILIEVCVDSAEGLDAAMAGGADRIELCAALDLGGLTPAFGLMQAAARCGLPVHAMIRPRAGDFVFGRRDLAVMRDDIAAARAAGLAGIVTGAMRGRSLDGDAMAGLADAAQGMDITLHRAVDLCQDWRAAVDLAVALGFRRILTSGGAQSAGDGAARLAEIFAAAKGRISVMPGAGITAATLPLLAHLPLTEVHASCSEPGPAVSFGFGAPRRTSAARIRQLRAALVDLRHGSG